MKSAANGRCMVEQKPHEILLPLETATRLALVAAGIGHGLAPDARGSVGQPARHGAVGARGRAASPGRPASSRAEAPAHGLACTSKKGTFLGSRDPVSAAASGSPRPGVRPGMWWPAGAWW